MVQISLEIGEARQGSVKAAKCGLIQHGAMRYDFGLKNGCSRQRPSNVTLSSLT